MNTSFVDVAHVEDAWRFCKDSPGLDRAHYSVLIYQRVMVSGSVFRGCLGLFGVGRD